MNIYWTNDILKRDGNSALPDGPDMSLCFLKPEPLSKNIPPYIKNSQYIKCPAFTEIMKNTYVLKMPFDFGLKIDLTTNKMDCEASFLPLVKSHVSPPVGTERIWQFYTQSHFFADKPCIAQQSHPFLHSNTLTSQCNVLGGEFDIHKWYRPFNAAFTPSADKKVLVFDFKRGDVISYVRFFTEEKIKMFEFSNTWDIQAIANQCVSFKHAKKGIFSLPSAYSSFVQKQRNKKLLNLIKQNIIGEI